MLIMVQLINKLDQVHIFQCIYFGRFQIHLQVIMYHFERTNYGIHLDFFFSNFFPTFF